MKPILTSLGLSDLFPEGNTIYTGVLKLLSERFEGCVHEDPLRGLIEEAWRTAAKRMNTYPWKLDEPIWTIGSKLCNARKCSICPVKELCDKSKGVRFRNGELACAVNTCLQI